MALSRAKDQDLSKVGQRTAREQGWYQWAVQGQKLTEAKSTQAMGELALKQLGEQDNPDSGKGSQITFRVMFPDIADEDAFQADLITKSDGKVTQENVAEVMQERINMAREGVVKAGLALFGYGEFSPVPRWNKEAKTYMYEDGTTATRDDWEQAKAQQNAEAYDRVVGVFSGEEDVTRYTVYGNIKHKEFNGNTMENIGYIRCDLPQGAKLVEG
jgi:hypothetical protein